MIKDWLDDIFAGAPLVYVCSLAGRPYATQWTTYAGEVAPGRHAFDFLLDLDPAAIDQGGPPVHQRSRLTTDDALRPLDYVATANNTRWSVAFAPTATTIVLPDGSSQVHAGEPPRFAFEYSLPGQMALVLAELAATGGLGESAALSLYNLNQFVVVPYRLDRKADQLYTSSHHEDIEMRGRQMLRSDTPKQSVERRLARPGPALPIWRDDAVLGKPPLRYQPPTSDRFRLEDITIAGSSTPIGGTLSIPVAPVAVAMFVAGSGTHDRHGFAGELDIGTHELMDQLAERGVLGLRCDSRGAGTTKLGEDVFERGVNGLVEDARVALRALEQRSEAAGLPRFLIGHSQGGLIALLLANEAPANLAGVVLMACPGRSIDRVIADQLRAQAEKMGLSAEQIARQERELEELVALLRAGTAWEPEKIPDYLFDALRSAPWLREHLEYAPAQQIAALACPVLVCQGAKDFQVSPKHDAQVLVDAARAAGVAHTYRLFPALDHLFKPIAGDSTLQSYFEDRRVDAGFIATVASWILETGAVRA